MPIIEGIRIQNYRVLKDITLGGLWNTPNVAPLTPISVVIGKNGVGKSSLIDAFGFLADCLKLGVEEACDQRGRGGFDRICSQGSFDPIEFMVFYREEPESQLIIYDLVVDKDESGRPFVSQEILSQYDDRRDNAQHFYFLILDNGKGVTWAGDDDGLQILEGLAAGIDIQGLSERVIEDQETANNDNGPEIVHLQDNRKLGIATLGALSQHPRISAFREFIEGWYLSYFTPDAARSLPLAGPQRRLSIHGDNLANVVQYMEREHPDEFDSILNKIAARVPGIDKIDAKRTEDGRLLLRFNDRGFEDPFYAQQMSDGTLKLFAYLLLMEDPNPPPFICIEEPENGLYHKLLEILAAEFRAHATGQPNSPQIFITTHQPYLVDALTPEEVWVLEKQDDGFATIRRASDDPIVKAMADEGLPLGSLWYSDYLDRRLPDAL